MKKNNLVLTALIVILFTAVNCFSQSIGKIYTKTKADSLFGKVQQTVNIKAADLLKLVNKTDKHVMFRFVKGKVLVAGDKRKILNDTAAVVNPKDVFRIYTKDKVLELLNKNKNATIKMENRANTITLTNGVNTLEEAGFCPPDCP